MRGQLSPFCRKLAILESCRLAGQNANGNKGPAVGPTESLQSWMPAVLAGLAGIGCPRVLRELEDQLCALLKACNPGCLQSWQARQEWSEMEWNGMERTGREGKIMLIGGLVAGCPTRSRLREVGVFSDSALAAATTSHSYFRFLAL